MLEYLAGGLFAQLPGPLRGGDVPGPPDGPVVSRRQLVLADDEIHLLMAEQKAILNIGKACFC